MMNLITLDEDPGKILRRKMPLVDEFEIHSERFQKDIDSMIDAMYSAAGLGLAANQIGLERRVFVILDEKDAPKVFINPYYVMKTPKMIKSYEEGCLSCGPTVRKDIRRHRAVVVMALDRDGQKFRYAPKNKLINIAIQHEMDHLRGVLIIDK